jgi:NitT/TauT family transport system permease protein
LALRKPISTVQSVVLGVVCVASCLVVWWLVTLGPGESRLVGPLTLPSPAETFGRFPQLWYEFALTRNLLVTLRRVSTGFALAMVVGIPLGVLAGCYPRLNAFLSPLVMLGRNIPLAAVLPLMLFIFGTGEKNKVMFIFVASVAFVISDAARAINDVATRYIDTAYTLGANRWQTIMKVLVPLAAPTIFSACRQMFGLAFGYIMLAETIKESDSLGGIGHQIQTFQRVGPRENIYLIILVIPLVALVIDQILYWIQRQLFPHVYGGDGILRDLLRFLLNMWEDLKGMIFGSRANLPAPVSNAPSEKSDANAAEKKS